MISSKNNGNKRNFLKTSKNQIYCHAFLHDRKRFGQAPEKSSMG